MYDHCATTSETKVDGISDIKIETKNAFCGHDTQQGSIIVTDQLEVVGEDAVEVAFIEALQKSLILTGIQLAKMEGPLDVIFVSPFFIGQLIAQINL